MLRELDVAKDLGLGDCHVGPAVRTVPKDSVTVHVYVDAVAHELDRSVGLAAALLHVLAHPSVTSWQNCFYTLTDWDQIYSGRKLR